MPGNTIIKTVCDCLFTIGPNLTCSELETLAVALGSIHKKLKLIPKVFYLFGCYLDHISLFHLRTWFFLKSGQFRFIFVSLISIANRSLLFFEICLMIGVNYLWKKNPRQCARGLLPSLSSVTIILLFQSIYVHVDERQRESRCKKCMFVEVVLWSYDCCYIMESRFWCITMMHQILAV